MGKRDRVVNEVIWTVREAAKGQGFVVEFDNVEPRDVVFMAALARVAEVWWAAMARRSRR